MLEIARILPGAQPFKHHNINATYNGQIAVGLQNSRVLPAIVKDIPAYEIAYEFIFARLASVLGLPVPESYVAYAPKLTLSGKHGPQIANDSENGRLYFASARIGAQSLAQQYFGGETIASIARTVGNWTKTGRLYAFDTWAANPDRNVGNILFLGPADFWLIDHGLCLMHKHLGLDQLEAASAYPNKLTDWLLPHIAAAQKISFFHDLDSFPTVVPSNPRQTVEEIVNEVSSLLDPADSKTIIDFLSDRLNQVLPIASKSAGRPRLVS